jgi:hypothetical protein
VHCAAALHAEGAIVVDGLAAVPALAMAGPDDGAMSVHAGFGDVADVASAMVADPVAAAAGAAAAGVLGGIADQDAVAAKQVNEAAAAAVDECGNDAGTGG